jgi:hypothetical protein
MLAQGWFEKDVFQPSNALFYFAESVVNAIETKINRIESRVYCVKPRVYRFFKLLKQLFLMLLILLHQSFSVLLIEPIGSKDADDE